MALLEEDDEASNDGSESPVNYEVEDTTNQEQLEKNNQALRTEQVYPIYTTVCTDHFYRSHRMSGSGGILCPN
jgi:coproporphyrinogen III oxidase